MIIWLQKLASVEKKRTSTSSAFLGRKIGVKDGRIRPYSAAKVALAVAVDNLLDAPMAAGASFSAQLGASLNAGVRFNALGVYNERSGAPWADPVSASPILNYVYGERKPVDSPVQVTFDLSFEPARTFSPACALAILHSLPSQRLRDG